MELHAAATELGRLVGKDLPDDLLGRIFARFCVGK
jgi:tRNA U34 5-carboxymethylaminomethyl modifying GTPase MnmE/TrmE